MGTIFNNYILINKNERKAFSLHFHVVDNFFCISFDRKIKIKIKIGILLPCQLLERGAKQTWGPLHTLEGSKS
jgi:hypothetical protein